MPARPTALLLTLLTLAACRMGGVQPEPTGDVLPVPPEAEVQLFPLAGPCAERDAEISGLGWIGEDLVLLPQYPGRLSPGANVLNEADAGRSAGAFCVLAKADLLAAVDGDSREALRPRLVPFEGAGVAGQAEGYEGYEAIAFRGDRVYLAVESVGSEAMQGYLVEGTVAITPDGRLGGVRLEARTLVPLPAQTRVRNLSYETLLATPRGIVALQEANGIVVNPAPEAYLFDDGALRDSLDVPTLEYRLTDATTLDAEGRFWGINYFYPGDYGTLRPGPDSLEMVFGTGWTHQREAIVERLVEFRVERDPVDGDRIVRTARPPIQLRLLGAGRARNWEGLARLDDRGFVLATDTYPETLLGFVAAPE